MSGYGKKSPKAAGGSPVTATQKKMGFSEAPVKEAPQVLEAAARIRSSEQALAAATSPKGSCKDYLALFGLDADSEDAWSAKHLARVQAEAQPMLEIVVRGHEELEGHTWYVLDCAIWRPCMDFGRAEWRCHRRLAHLREGLHDQVKELLGSTLYAEHFGDTPFAAHGGFSGTTSRLLLWCQSLGKCINSCAAPPPVAAAVLRLLSAPAKDPAMIALARTCAEDTIVYT
eukprot:TRINITY_DN78041_c0_g1_i1.p1 TRINITY_DN78041_c0_g1~~TRINITY_DN78041_c0_g1_i1.p1  ORF type:complete len:229 (-),score=39.89 TRINITY_DN78041_c0_g1_i1:77-763(-)